MEKNSMLLLSDLAYLTRAWRGHLSPAPNALAVWTAHNFVLAFDFPEPPSISHCVHGGISLLYESVERRIQVDCFNCGAIMAAWWHEANHPNIEEVRLDEDFDRLSSWLAA